MEIQFNKNVYKNVPESYDEMTLGKFMDIMLVQEEATKFKSQTLYSAKLLATIIGCSDTEVLSLEADDVDILLEEFHWLSEQPIKDRLDNVEIDGVTYVCKKNPRLTLGEQVSIETFLREDLRNTKNFHLIIAILLRPGIKKEDEYSGSFYYEMKELESNFDMIVERAELFKEKLMINKIFGTLHFFSNGGRKSSTKTSVGFSIRKEGRKSPSSEKK